MRDDTLRRTALWAVVITFGCAAAWLTFKYAPGIILPFAVAYLISRPVRAAAHFLGRSRPGAEKLWCVLLIISAAWGIIWLIWRLASSFTGELSGIVSAINAELSSDNGILHRLMDVVDDIAGRFPLLFPSGDGDVVYSAAESLLSFAGTKLSSFAASATTKALSSLPGLIFASVAAVVALFYMCLGSFSFSDTLRSLFPSAWQKKGSGYIRRITSVFGRYLRAYGTIMLLTFSELFLGMVILRVNYALAVSAMIAVIDILPVLGVGSVLVPWSIISFITGDYYRGAGLLILFGIIYAVRQVAEPRILSGCMGINPLVALFSVYAGLRLFGIWGMILAPVTVCAFSEIVIKKDDFTSARRTASTGKNTG